MIAAYYQASEDGQEPQLRALIQQHPDLEAELVRYFVDQEKLRRVTEPFRSPEGIDREAALPGACSPRGAEDTRSLHSDSAGVLADLVGPGQLVDGVRQFGDYELLEQLAIGGMGVVYKAREISLNRLVALKMIRSGEFASAVRHPSVPPEAEMVANLDHPSIVPIYEVGEHGGDHFFIMKLLEGGTLAAHLDEYASDPQAAVRVIATLARAIHHAHQRGILHRDLKPSNILLDAQGEPLIADFGLAKRLDAASDLTATGAVVGTPPYMAPEATLGRKGAVTTATDVYGLGAILYALLTGRAAVPGRLDLGADREGQGATSRASPAVQPAGRRRPPDDLPEVPGEGPRARYSSRPGPGRRPGTLVQRRANPRPTEQLASPRLALVPPPGAAERDGRVRDVRGSVAHDLGVPGHHADRARPDQDAGTGGLILHVSGWIALAYLPMILIGWHATQAKVWAIRAGLFHAIVLMTINTINVLGLFRFGIERITPESDPVSMSLGLTLFYLAVAFIAAVYAIANISLAANRRPPRTR